MDAHSEVFEVHMQLAAITGILGAGSGDLSGLTCEKLYFLLHPIEQKLEKVLPELEKTA